MGSIVHQRILCPRRAFSQAYSPDSPYLTAILIELQVDGVTRCLARLLAHLREQGHEAVVLGPQSGMVRPIETLLLVPQP